MAVVMTWGLDSRARDANGMDEIKGADVKRQPKIAWLSDSVPPLVKTISWGLAPMSAATRSRAVSTAARACWPGVWIEEALPKSADRKGSMASRTAGSTGVVAL